MKSKEHYPLTHNQIKIFAASSGVQQFSIDNAFLGPIPESILIAFVKNTTFVGSAISNPFHFHHYDMTNVVLFVKRVQKLSEPLKIDCSSNVVATRAYETLFKYGYPSRRPRSHDYTRNVHKVFLLIRI